MSCDEARDLLLDAQRGRLAAEPRARLDSHLAACPSTRPPSR